MGLFDSLTGAAQRRDVWKGAEEATGLLNSATDTANNRLTAGTRDANALLRSGQARGNAALTRGAMTARADVNRGSQAAIGTLQPYARQGAQANTMYGNALGLGGTQARADAQGVYMSDPIMEALMNQSNENVLQRYNASGLANSGVSRAAILQNQLSNYGNWLDRLANQGQTGAQAATNIANVQQGRGTSLAGLAQQLGQNQADNTYRFAMPQAGNRVDLGANLARNALNLGQQRAGLITDARSASANTRGMGWQNAMSLLGSGVNAAAGIQNAGGLSKLARGLL